MREVERLSRAIESLAPLGGNVSYKLGSVRNWASILYSARKHRQWADDRGKTVRGHALNEVAGLRIAIGIYFAAERGDE